VADADEVLSFIAGRKLSGSGIGYVDVHLLAAAALTPETFLWTRDSGCMPALNPVARRQDRGICQWILSTARLRWPSSHADPHLLRGHRFFRIVDHARRFMECGPFLTQRGYLQHTRGALDLARLSNISASPRSARDPAQFAIVRRRRGRRLARLRCWLSAQTHPNSAAIGHAGGA